MILQMPFAQKGNATDLLGIRTSPADSTSRVNVYYISRTYIPGLEKPKNVGAQSNKMK